MKKVIKKMPIIMSLLGALIITANYNYAYGMDSIDWQIWKGERSSEWDRIDRLRAETLVENRTRGNLDRSPISSGGEPYIVGALRYLGWGYFPSFQIVNANKAMEVLGDTIWDGGPTMKLKFGKSTDGMHFNMQEIFDNRDSIPGHPYNRSSTSAIKIKYRCMFLGSISCYSIYPAVRQFEIVATLDIENGEIVMLLKKDKEPYHSTGTQDDNWHINVYKLHKQASPLPDFDDFEDEKSPLSIREEIDKAFDRSFGEARDIRLMKEKIREAVRKEREKDKEPGTIKKPSTDSDTPSQGSSNDRSMMREELRTLLKEELKNLMSEVNKGREMIGTRGGGSNLESDIIEAATDMANKMREFGIEELEGLTPQEIENAYGSLKNIQISKTQPNDHKGAPVDFYYDGDGTLIVYENGFPRFYYNQWKMLAHETYRILGMVSEDENYSKSTIFANKLFSARMEQLSKKEIKNEATSDLKLEMEKEVDKTLPRRSRSITGDLAPTMFLTLTAQDEAILAVTEQRVRGSISTIVQNYRDRAEQSIRKVNEVGAQEKVKLDVELTELVQQYNEISGNLDQMDESTRDEIVTLFSLLEASYR